VNRRRSARVFWLGAAAILVAAALIALVAVLRGSFSETDGRILGTLGALLYCGAAALAGLALVDRGVVPALGWGMAALSTATLAALSAAIWTDGDRAWRVAISAALYLLAGAVATTGLLLTTRPVLHRLALVAGALAVIAASLTLFPVWRDDDPGSGLAKAIGVAWILAALAYLLAPVMERWTAVGELAAGERVLAALGEVELVATRHPGDALVVVGRPRQGERLVLRRTTRVEPRGGT
jgi:hypothetical protein